MKTYQTKKLEIILVDKFIGFKGETFDKVYRRDQFNLVLLGDRAILVDKETQDPVRVFKFEKIFMSLPL